MQFFRKEQNNCYVKKNVDVRILLKKRTERYYHKIGGVRIGFVLRI